MPITKRRIITVLAFISLGLVACGQQKGVDWRKANNLPPRNFVANAQQGETFFKNNCLVCHGANGRGSQKGPPLVHKIYEPGHHSDLAFYRAVKNGTKQHHWNFGDMPAPKNVTAEQAGHIVAYIRQQQRQAGIH